MEESLKAEITDGLTAKAGHLPGSINQDTICVDKTGSDSEIPWHSRKKNQLLIWLMTEVVCRQQSMRLESWQGLYREALVCGTRN